MSQLPLRRIVDLLVIVAIASGLLALAWETTKRPLTTETPDHLVLSKDVISSAPQLEATTPELLLPLERIGMVLMRENIAGTPERGIEHLEQRCREALRADAEWVLPLDVSSDERRLLDTIVEGNLAFELPGSSNRRVRLYSLTSPTTRIGVREADGEGAAIGRRLLCWGFIAAEGTDQQTVWFARPRQSLSSPDPRQGPLP